MSLDGKYMTRPVDHTCTYCSVDPFLTRSYPGCIPSYLTASLPAPSLSQFYTLEARSSRNDTELSFPRSRTTLRQQRRELVWSIHHHKQSANIVQRRLNFLAGYMHLLEKSIGSIDWSGTIDLTWDKYFFFGPPKQTQSICISAQHHSAEYGNTNRLID